MKNGWTEAIEERDKIIKEQKQEIDRLHANIKNIMKRYNIVLDQEVRP